MPTSRVWPLGDHALMALIIIIILILLIIIIPKGKLRFPAYQTSCVSDMSDCMSE